jgi:ketosteroid isomerase-like protein
VTPEQVVRSIYDAWLQRSSAREWIAEDVEYVNPHDAVETGVKHGRQYFRGIRDVYDEVVITPVRVEPVGDEDVLVIADLTGTASGSGVEIETRQGYIWTVRDGVAVRFQWFGRPAEALAAAGLPE